MVTQPSATPGGAPVTSPGDAPFAKKVERIVKLNYPRDRYDSDWASVRTATPAHACQVVKDDGTAFPAIDSNNLTQFRSVSLSFAVGGLKLAPHVVVKLTLYRSPRKSTPVIVWQGRLTIPLGRSIRPKTKDCPDIDFSKTKGLTAFTRTVSDTFLDVSMTFDTAIPRQLQVSDHVCASEKVTDSEKEMFKYFSELSRGSHEKKLRLKVFFSKKERGEKAMDLKFGFLELTEAFEKLLPYEINPYSGYLREGFPKIQPNNMKPPQVRINDGSPHMPVSGSIELRDPIEAEIQFGYDAENEAAEEEKLLDQYEEVEHKAKFVSVGDHVLALVKFSRPDNFFDAKNCLQAGLEVDLRFVRSDTPTPLKATFFVSSTSLSLPITFDTVMISKKKERRWFGKLVVDIKDLHKAIETRVSMDIRRMDLTYKRRINAISTIWDAEKGRQDLWPVLLNNDPSALPISNPFEAAGVSSSDADTAIQRVLNDPHQMLNDRQQEVIRGCREIPGGIKIVQASGGTGKTHVECLVANMFASVDITPIMMAPTNGAVEAICSTYSRVFRGQPQPLRVPASNIDADGQTLGITSTARGKDEFDVKDQDILEAEVIATLKDQHLNEKRSQDCVDLLREVIRLSESRERMVRAHYTDGVDEETRQPLVDGPEVDMVEEFANYLKKARSDDGEAFFNWDDSDKRRYRQSLKHIKADIVAHAAVVACTTISSALSVVRRNVGTQKKGKYVLLIDEAGRDREADTLVPLATYDNNVVAVFLIGDIQQDGPVCVSSREFNEFHDRGKVSLMERLVTQGFPTINLNTQYRMHPVLFKFPNDAAYDGLIKTAQSANVPPPADLSVVLMQILGIEKPDLKKRELVILRYIQIENGEVRRSSRSHSRANLQNVEWVMNAVEKLQEVLKGKMQEKVVIISPYKRQKEEYDSRIQKLRHKKDLPIHNVPKMATVDSFRGHEAEIVLLDLVNTDANKIIDVGFMTDDRRTNVAMTRGKLILWMIGGKFGGRLSELKPKDDKNKNPFEPNAKAKLCSLMDYIRRIRAANRETIVRAPSLTEPVPADLWLPGERKSGDGDKDGGWGAAGSNAGNDTDGDKNGGNAWGVDPAPIENAQW